MGPLWRIRVSVVVGQRNFKSIHFGWQKNPKESESGILFRSFKYFFFWYFYVYSPPPSFPRTILNFPIKFPRIETF